MPNAPFEADVVVIGSGFGGTMTALTIAHTLKPEASRVEWENLRTMLANRATDPAAIDAQRRRVNELNAADLAAHRVSARTARIDPHWDTQPDPFLPADSPRSVKRLGSDKRYWLDRARVFQKAIRTMRPDGFHTVDSSINDLTPERTPPHDPYDPRVPANHPTAMNMMCSGP